MFGNFKELDRFFSFGNVAIGSDKRCGRDRSNRWRSGRKRITKINQESSVRIESLVSCSPTSSSQRLTGQSSAQCQKRKIRVRLSKSAVGAGGLADYRSVKAACRARNVWLAGESAWPAPRSRRHLLGNELPIHPTFILRQEEVPAAPTQEESRSRHQSLLLKVESRQANY